MKLVLDTNRAGWQKGEDIVHWLLPPRRAWSISARIISGSALALGQVSTAGAVD